MKYAVITITLIFSFLNKPLHAGGVEDLINHYATQAKSETKSFVGFDFNRGKDLYLKEFTSGKKDTPSCTSCHTNNPTQIGETRAGKAIEPMAVSVNPKRYQTLKKAEKWFRRNCKSVLGRECTATEKGDFLIFMRDY
jgi:hypothetical protein